LQHSFKLTEGNSVEFQFEAGGRERLGTGRTGDAILRAREQILDFFVRGRAVAGRVQSPDGLVERIIPQ